MIDPRFARAAGACAVIGGSAWVLASVMHALQPIGCVGDECLVRPQREATTGTSWLVVVAVVAMVAFLLALVAWLGRSGRLGWTGTVGVAVCGLGVVSLAVMALPRFREQMRPLSGMVAMAFGLALVGWTLLRSRVVPLWAAVGLLVGVLLLAGVSEQNSRGFLRCHSAWLG